MKISVIGYMGSGKSHISKILSKKLNCKLIDLDREIMGQNKMKISEIFNTKGEIYFRKQERAVLGDILLAPENLVISLGGGTPAYYDNMELINQNSESIFLRTSIKSLTERLLKHKEKRPLIAKIPNADLPEFIGKHLFERNVYYNQSKYIVDTDGKTPEEIVNEIVALIHFQNLNPNR